MLFCWCLTHRAVFIPVESREGPGVCLSVILSESESASVVEGPSAAGGKRLTGQGKLSPVRDLWLPPAGRSFDYARGLAFVRDDR